MKQCLTRKISFAQYLGRGGGGGLVASGVTSRLGGHGFDPSLKPILLRQNLLL